jgi:hypothetical protein
MPSHQFAIMQSRFVSHLLTAQRLSSALSPAGGWRIVGYCYVMAVAGTLVRPRPCVGGAVGGCEGGDSNEPPMSLLAM